MADWLTDSNDALTLTLRRDETDAASAKPSFHPQFSYEIFGDEQKIFGYRGLDVKIDFTSGSLHQLLRVNYQEKIASDATPADDIPGLLSSFLAADHTTSEAEFQTRLDRDATAFRPFGTKIGSYTRSTEKKPEGKGKGREKKRRYEADDEAGEGIEFEMWKTSWKDAGFKEYHRRMQIFILFYIEGGSFIQEDEEAWEFVVLYEKRRRPSSTANKRTATEGATAAATPEATTSSSASDAEYSYHFAGYTSLYPFYHHPERIRLRLSQFVILPPYQTQGHGSALYSKVYQHCLDRPLVAELTIEDPSEAFEDLRDVCDLRMLERLLRPGSSSSLASSLDIRGPPKPKRELEEIRRSLKLAGRQFARLYEMLLMFGLREGDSEAAKKLRLFVKERLYRFNYEILNQLEPRERIVKLEETFRAVEEDYERILERAALEI